jgi:hypothetical protein
MSLGGALAQASLGGPAPPIHMIRSIGEMLASCRGFATLDQHLSRLHHDLNLPDDQQAGVRQVLTEATENGLLVSQDQLLRSLRAATAREPLLRLEGLGVVTKNRPEAALRCLRSFGEHLARHQRRLPLMVVDSSDQDGAKSLRHEISGLRRQLGTEVALVGREEKLRLAVRLNAAVDIDPGLIHFALFGLEAIGYDVGANRNTLLLLHAGRNLFATDDDIECDLRTAKPAAAQLNLSSDERPSRVVLHRDFTSARSSLMATEHCVLDPHERLLGRSVGGCLTGVPDSAVAFGPIAPELMGALLRGTARTVASFGGYYGDSGARYPGFFLWSDPEVRHQLLGGVQHYRELLASRQVVRMPVLPTISGSAFSMCPTVALDCRELLPPFFPVMRGEDLSFGQIVRRCFEDSLFCYVPWAVAHRPWEARVGSADQLWDPAPFVSMPTLIGQMVELARPTLQMAPSGERRLRLLGRCIQEAAGLPTSDFLDLVRSRVNSMIGLQTAQLGQLLETRGGHPAYWAQDLSRYIEHQDRILANPDRALPLDLLHLGDAAARATVFQTLLLRYGELLTVWPDLFSAAREAGGAWTS